MSKIEAKHEILEVFEQRECHKSNQCSWCKSESFELCQNKPEIVESEKHLKQKLWNNAKIVVSKLESVQQKLTTCLQLGISIIAADSCYLAKEKTETKQTTQTDWTNNHQVNEQPSSRRSG